MTRARTPVREVGLAEAVELARAGYRVIDVREPVEWAAGHVAGATLIPLGELHHRIAEVAPDRDTPILVHCAVGERSGRAAAWLADLGYVDVVNLRGPIDGWRAAGGGWEEPDDGLSEAQRRRYARQLVLAEVGVSGQRALLDARVVILGAGGLGSPAALWLAATGVGALRIVDDDRVDESNLARQVLHPTRAVGEAKAASAARTIGALNPDVRVEAVEERLRPENAARLIDGADLVVDGTDNLEARYALNDAAVGAGVSVVHGSIYRWHGQVTTLAPGRGPCYRCLHPVPPPAELAPECAVAGVIGVLPGLLGMLQATEAVKLLLGAGEPLIGRLLMVDALGMRFEELRVDRDPACPACGRGTARWAASG